MQGEIRKVVIIGGGTAGWITAGLLAAQHRGAGTRDLDVVLIESPDIPTIGVGEGTWPSMRMTLQKIGIHEADLVRECDASFKQGTEFIDWSETGGEDVYYHPFSFPAEYSGIQTVPSGATSGRRGPAWGVGSAHWSISPVVAAS